MKFFLLSLLLNFGTLSAGESLVLYTRGSCHYSKIVLDYVKTSSLSLRVKDLSLDPKFSRELLKVGGKIQVPCLVIDGKALYESKKIVLYLKKVSLLKDQQ